MYGKTADKAADISRTASHATKPFASGRIELLPPGARVHNETYNSLKQQMDLLTAQRMKVQEELHGIRTSLLSRLSWEEADRLKKRQEFLREHLKEMEDKHGLLRESVMAAHLATIAEVFLQEARAMLDAVQFSEILEASRSLVGEATGRQYAEVPGKSRSGHKMTLKRRRQRAREKLDRRPSCSGLIVRYQEFDSALPASVISPDRTSK